MIHRHLQGQAWSLMAIESLFERGKLPDWQEFGRALRESETLASATLRVAAGPVDAGSAELARTLVFHLYPGLRQATTARLPRLPVEAAT
jgi:hypothetical protein